MFLWWVLAIICACDAYKILVVFPMPSRSHGILGDGVVRVLINAGHDVTYITPFPVENPHPKLRVIDVSSNIDSFLGWLSFAKKVAWVAPGWNSILGLDLKQILDSAKTGLIYFSLGSNLKSKDMPDDLKRSMLNMFSGFQQTVLWKFEEKLSDLPRNVHVVQWAPQTSVLAHPNCIIFITHGGGLSSTEAIHFGKPTIGIPVFGDQFMNVDKAVMSGHSLRVDLSLDMPEKLKMTIEEMLRNQSYAAKAKELSFIYHHRPVPPAAELVHWVEHVVRTGGAPPPALPRPQRAILPESLSRPRRCPRRNYLRGLCNAQVLLQKMSVSK
ncbi:hypothetical protein ACJJTC_018469 [Scirpophaga incertulas]